VSYALNERTVFYLQGDSGGPLMCSRDQTTWKLVGITSWGSSVCGAPNSPGVYTRITEYRSWIMSVIERGI